MYASEPHPFPAPPAAAPAELLAPPRLLLIVVELSRMKAEVGIELCTEAMLLPRTESSL